MRTTIRFTRAFFRSALWHTLVLLDPTNLNGGTVLHSKSGRITLHTRISFLLWIEGRFNDAAAAYFAHLRRRNAPMLQSKRYEV